METDSPGALATFVSGMSLNITDPGASLWVLALSLSLSLPSIFSSKSVGVCTCGLFRVSCYLLNQLVQLHGNVYARLCPMSLCVHACACVLCAAVGNR